MKLRVTLWVCSLPMSPVSSSHLSPIPSFLTHLKTKPTDSHSSDTISHYSMPTLCQIHGKPITSLGLQSPNKDGFVTVVILKYVHKFTDTPSIQRRGLILFPFSMGWTWWLPSNRIKQKLQGAIFSAGLWQLLLLLSLASLAEKSQLLRHGDTVAESRVPCGEELRPPVGSPMSEPGSRSSSPCQARW